MIPSLFPIFDAKLKEFSDGLEISICKFCRSAITEKPQCNAHYTALMTKPEGYHQCPFGFTSRSFLFEGQMWVVSGIVAHPRFNTDNERRMAKQYSANKVTRDAIEGFIRFMREVESYRADAIKDSAKVLPQAFHELRKLNGAIIQHAEIEMSERGETRNLLSIKAAAELVTNNFDILEALSNIDSMRALPSDSTISLFDLVFKMKRVLQARAEAKGMSISVQGPSVLIKGSQKSFPIVPAVLLDNAIKYGMNGYAIYAGIVVKDNKVILTVENTSTLNLDTERCFERGVRFAPDIEGGGYGLYLAKEIVIAHGGTIRASIQSNVVSMIVELPFKGYKADPQH